MLRTMQLSAVMFRLQRQQVQTLLLHSYTPIKHNASALISLHNPPCKSALTKTLHVRAFFLRTPIFDPSSPIFSKIAGVVPKCHTSMLTLIFNLNANIVPFTFC